jgi:amino acid transporter
MAVYAPISGGYIHYIERWLHPAVGFAVGWQVCIQYCLFLPSEVIAANILISYWDAGESQRMAVSLYCYLFTEP